MLTKLVRKGYTSLMLPGLSKCLILHRKRTSSCTSSQTNLLGSLYLPLKYFTPLKYLVLNMLVLGPDLFNTVINNLEDVMDCILSKFASGTKLGGLVDMLEGRTQVGFRVA